MIFTDVLFANNYNLSSQIEFIITLVNSENNANITYLSIIKCKRRMRVY